MHEPRLVSGYVIRVWVRDHRWRILLLDLASGGSLEFDDFTALAERLELEAARRAVSQERPAAHEQGTDPRP